MYLYEKNKEGTYKLKNKIEAVNGKRKIRDYEEKSVNNNLL